MYSSFEKEYSFTKYTIILKAYKVDVAFKTLKDNIDIEMADKEKIIGVGISGLNVGEGDEVRLPFTNLPTMNFSQAK